MALKLNFTFWKNFFLHVYILTLVKPLPLTVMAELPELHYSEKLDWYSLNPFCRTMRTPSETNETYYFNRLRLQSLSHRVNGPYSFVHMNVCVCDCIKLQEWGSRPASDCSHFTFSRMGWQRSKQHINTVIMCELTFRSQNEWRASVNNQKHTGFQRWDFLYMWYFVSSSVDIITLLLSQHYYADGMSQKPEQNQKQHVST